MFSIILSIWISVKINDTSRIRTIHCFVDLPIMNITQQYYNWETCKIWRTLSFKINWIKETTASFHYSFQFIFRIIVLYVAVFIENSNYPRNYIFQIRTGSK